MAVRFQGGKAVPANRNYKYNAKAELSDEVRAIAAKAQGLQNDINRLHAMAQELLNKANSIRWEGGRADRQSKFVIDAEAIWQHTKDMQTALRYLQDEARDFRYENVQ